MPQRLVLALGSAAVVLGLVAVGSQALGADPGPPPVSEDLVRIELGEAPGTQGGQNPPAAAVEPALPTGEAAPGLTQAPAAPSAAAATPRVVVREPATPRPVAGISGAGDDGEGVDDGDDDDGAERGDDDGDAGAEDDGTDDDN